MAGTLRDAVSGVLAAGCGIAVAELLAAATRPGAGPLVAVGGAVIDVTPTPVKELAVRTLGTYDKPVLLGSIALVLVVLTAAAGILARRSRWYAIGAAAVLGLVGAAAAVSRPVAAPYDAVPSVLASAIAAAVLIGLSRRAATPVNRRAFLKAAALVGGSAALAGFGADLIRRGRSSSLAESREAIRLPAPADPARQFAAPPGFVTPNTGFYRVDTALTVPRLDAGSWSLRIHGMVDRPVELSFRDLLDRPLIERDVTLTCVSNEVGGPYAGTARWLGVPLAPLLREAGIRSGADQVIARSADGMTIGTPVETVLDGRDTMLCVGMNGEPLPLEHGFPVRMLTPGLYGYAGACKWLTDLELGTFAEFDAYWVRRGWAAHGPVKTASRIDRPQPFARPAAGTVTVAGVAWAQGRGVRTVEVQVDGGEWRPAELLPVPSVDTWVQWRFAWRTAPGPHSLRVRATDGTGVVQPEQRATPFPDGATGWHTITVTVG